MVTIPRPIPTPAMLLKPSSTEVIACAAMAVVPSVETVDCMASLPNWNIPFSIPVGIPKVSIILTIGKSGRIEK
jgi:hypothetical protein